MQLTAVFGFLALTLAAIGLYGVTAYSVAQRTSEIGIRMALGADRKGILQMVLRSAFLQAGIGLAIGHDRVDEMDFGLRTAQPAQWLQIAAASGLAHSASR